MIKTAFCAELIVFLLVIAFLKRSWLKVWLFILLREFRKKNQTTKRIPKKNFRLRFKNYDFLMLCRTLDNLLQLSQFFDLRKKFIFFYQLVIFKLLILGFVVSLLPQVVFWNYFSRIFTLIGFSTYCEWFESCGYVLFPRWARMVIL